MPARKRLFQTIVMCVLSAALVAACEGEGPPPQAAGPVPVTVVTLKAQPVVLTRELPGRVSPFLVAEVRPQVSGIVQDRLFEEGALVEAGQPLYQLDDASYQAALASAQASLASALAARQSARVTAKRLAALVKSNAVSRQENDEAIAALRQAEADVTVAQAAVRSAEITLGYARIEAPIDGRIGASTVTKGALVTANQPAALATVQRLDPVYVDLTQSASELLLLRKELAAGTLNATRDVPVTILLEDGSRYPHAGKLTFAGVTVDPSTGSFSLRVQVPNPDEILLPGLYVRAVISVGERPNGLLAPQKGVTRDPRGTATALVVGADGKVEPRQIRVSRAIGDQWLVEDGLVAGDRVIVEGLQKVRPGAEVTTTEAEPADAEAPGGPPPTTATPPVPAADADADRQ